MKQPEALLDLPRQELQTRLATMPLAEQATLVLSSPWERRHEILLASPHATTLLRGLPVEELFWTVKAIGAQDAVHLLALATPAQLQFFFDLDWWRKAHLRPEKVASWLVLLFEAGEAAVTSWVRWLADHDEALLPALLGRFVRVVKRPDEVDEQEAQDFLPPFTLDDVFHVAFKAEGLQPLWMRFLFLVHAVSPKLYRDTMEALVWDTEAEMTEAAHQLRHARLNDWGLPDYYEALDIYAPAPGPGAAAAPSAPEEDSEAPLPVFVPTLYVGPCAVLRQALEGLFGHPADMERVMREWVGCANKILMVDDVDLDDPGALRQSLEKASHFLNLGLEVTLRYESASPSDILRRTFLEDLVRRANAEVRRLAGRARALVDSGLVPSDLAHLPDAWRDGLRGLLRKAGPLYWDSDLQAHRAFSTLDEIDATEALLENVELAARLMTAIEPHWSRWAQELSLSEANLPETDEVTWPIALRTALAQWTLTGQLLLRAVPEERLSALRERWFPAQMEPGQPGASGPEPAGTAVAGCLAALEPVIGRDGLDRDRVRALVAEILRHLGDEWHSLPPGEVIDGRFTEGLLVALEAPDFEAQD